jgi:integrase
MWKADRDLVRSSTKAAGVADWQHFTPHCFRHSFGTWEYERTGDAKYAQRVMRHARIEITLRIYVHDRRDDAELVVGRPAVAAAKPALRSV